MGLSPADSLGAVVLQEALERSEEAARRHRWVDAIVALEDVLQESALVGSLSHATVLLHLSEAYAGARRPGRAADLAASALLVCHGGGAASRGLARRARQALDRLAQQPVVGVCMAEDDPMSEAFVVALRQRGLTGPDLRSDADPNDRAVRSIRALLSHATTVVVLVGPELLARTDLMDALHASLRRTAARVGQPRFTLRSLHDRAASPINRILPVALPGVRKRPFWPDAPWVDARGASLADVRAAVDTVHARVLTPI